MTIIADMPEDEYHAHHAISQSGIWLAYTQSWEHYRKRKIEKTNKMTLGSAVHIAVLQPNLFESSVKKGPEDRRGNKWKDLVEECETYGGIPLTSGDYEKCLWMRDNAHKNRKVRLLTGDGCLVEHSAFWTDPETGVECRGRVDIHNVNIGINADLKTSASGMLAAWEASMTDYGYHLQEGMYGEGWELAGGVPVIGNLFIVVENEWPHCVAIFEAVPAAIEEGRAVIRRVLREYKECLRTDIWPGYPEEIQQCDIRRYGYRETNPFVEE